MIIAVRMIMHAAVTPTMDVITLEGDAWRDFLHASDTERIQTSIRILGKPQLTGKVREVAWIPMDGQDMLIEKKKKHEE